MLQLAALLFVLYLLFCTPLGEALWYWSLALLAFAATVLVYAAIPGAFIALFWAALS